MRHAKSIAIASLFLVVACSAGSVENLPESVGSESQEIIGGVPATDYPEAALIDMERNGRVYSACSGAVVAPRVVLTAGHCVIGSTGWRVKTPFANNQKAYGSKGVVFDYTTQSNIRNPDQHDVAVIILDTPITLTSYPSLAKTPIADGTAVINVGRIKGGQVSDTALYKSKSLIAKSATSIGYPFDYTCAEVVEPGDSGGPDYVPGTTPHLLVAVNSSGGGGREMLARVDLLATWLEGQITKNGGVPQAADAGAEAGTTADAGDSRSADAGVEEPTAPKADAGSGGRKRDGGASGPNASPSEEDPQEEVEYVYVPNAGGCGVAATNDAGASWGVSALFAAAALVFGKLRRRDR